MKKKVTLAFAAFALLLNLSFESSAQLSEEVVKKTPELPGEIVLDFGFNMLTGKPDYWNQVHWWRSKSVALYFIKPFDLSKKVEFRPGIGVSLEKIGSKNGNFLGEMYEDVDDDWDYKKGQYAINYIEIPLEMRFNFMGNDKKSSPYIGLGGMFAYIFDSHTKVKYSESGDTRKIKEKGDLGMTDLRIGLQARIGMGSVNVFYKYYMTPMFTDKGPVDTQDIMYSTVGISISGL
ncbi:hypothetical protein BFP72_18325 [Reichenbachiella sp. 5M10]|uniref:outer membrane beta-barrel protein n=1 Tax=Reichenbachiella sp. 5M10 TaxID=1889772 RepID=UPI000C145652|nr:outer membrane beta-barrel protein [Reichenbachiella sp. 5M10]PIB37223.1 hypothetical protein BFP72_18325 [Reichenbachiella sp. 5M10]